MKEQLKAKCLQLTEQILQEYYFRQPGRLFTHLDGEVVWIGAAAGQYVRGADKVRQYILGIVNNAEGISSECIYGRNDAYLASGNNLWL